MAPRRDAGETLVEVLVAVVILGVAVVQILGVLYNDVHGSVRHRSRATALTLQQQAAEYVKDQGFQAGCTKIADPAPGDVPRPAGYGITIAPPEGVAEDGSTNPCDPSDAMQLHRVTVTGVRGGPDVVDVVLGARS